MLLRVLATCLGYDVGSAYFCRRYINQSLLSFLITEELKGEKDAGKEVKAAKEETPKGNGKPPAERPRFMFNIADGGFTGASCMHIQLVLTALIFL